MLRPHRRRTITNRGAYPPRAELLEPRRLFAGGTVSGSVYLDADGGGTRDPGEAGAPDQIVYLDANSNYNHDPEERSARSGADGSFVFDAVDRGNYVLRLVVEQGWAQTQPVPFADYPLSVSDGSRFGGSDFGIAEPGTITGTVYRDANRNGRRDAGEGPGAYYDSVYVDYDGDGARDGVEPLSGALTDGTYRINDVLPGPHTVRLIPQPGYPQTDPAATEPGGLPAGRVVTVPAAGVVSGVDFGTAVTPDPARIAGFVFEDADGNGVLDPGENALVAGRVVYIDSDNSGTPGPNERSFTTQDSGYFFDDLAPGSYSVRVVVPAGYRQTRLPCNTPYVVTVGPGEQAGGYDFGLALAGPTTISGTVYEDADADGVRDAGEAPLADRVVYLDTDNDGAYHGIEPSALSDANGNYTIRDVAPGTYLVRQVLPGGSAQTEPGRDANSDRPLARTVSVLTGRPAAGVDFGSAQISRLSVISGVVFGDSNGNGVRDAGEAAPANQVVYLDADNDGTLDDAERRVTQGGENGYVFRDLAPGTYTVRVVVSPDDRQSFPAGGAAQAVTVGPGESAGGMNFGVAPAPGLRLSPVADAYVKDGTPDTNYGSAPELQVGRSVTPGLQRISFLRFDVNDLAAPGALGAATLRLYGAASSSVLPVTVDVFPSSNVTWSENSVTWDASPGTGYFDWLPPATITGTAPRWYDWDVTEYVRQQVAAGARSVTFALVGRSNIDPFARFNSREAADPATRPQLFVEPEPTDSTAPVRRSITVGSTRWTPQFVASLAARGLGVGGVSLPQYYGEDNLRRRLPWVNADTISVRFSEDVRVRQDHLRVLKWDEQRFAFVDAGYAYRDFRYDPATRVATWVLARPLGLDSSLRLELEGDAPDAIADAAGNRLYAGADSIQDFSTLPGDVTGEGRVDAQDLAFVRQRFNTTPADEAFSPFADVNGDNRVNALDLAAIRRHLNQTGG